MKEVVLVDLPWRWILVVLGGDGQLLIWRLDGFLAWWEVGGWVRNLII